MPLLASPVLHEADERFHHARIVVDHLPDVFGVVELRRVVDGDVTTVVARLRVGRFHLRPCYFGRYR